MGEENLAPGRKYLQIYTCTYFYACIYLVSTGVVEGEGQEGQL